LKWTEQAIVTDMRSELIGHHNLKYFRKSGEKTDRSKIGGEHGFETVGTGMTIDVFQR
jgi:hypothetical protein